MIDSSAIQETVKIATEAGILFLPEHFKLLAPAISALITAITAAIIRHFEKKNLETVYKRSLQNETELLNKRIEEIKRNKEL